MLRRNRSSTPGGATATVRGRRRTGQRCTGESRRADWRLHGAGKKRIRRLLLEKVVFKTAPKWTQKRREGHGEALEEMGDDVVEELAASLFSDR